MLSVKIYIVKRITWLWIKLGCYCKKIYNKLVHDYMNSGIMSTVGSIAGAKLVS